MGHKTIKIYRGGDGDSNSEDYNFEDGIVNTDDISRISVHTYKKSENKQVFDSVNVTIDEGIFERSIIWKVDIGLKAWHLICLVFLTIAYIVSAYYSWNICPNDYLWGRYCFALCVAFSFVIPLLLVYALLIRSFEKVYSHPDTQKYRREFEEFIKQKEKEMLLEI